MSFWPILFLMAYIRPLEIILAKKTTELVLFFHKKTTKLVFLWLNMGQKNIKVLINYFVSITVCVAAIFLQTKANYFGDTTFFSKIFGILTDNFNPINFSLSQRYLLMKCALLLICSFGSGLFLVKW